MKINLSNILFVALVLSVSFLCEVKSQEKKNWELQKSTDSIYVYTKLFEGSNYKSARAVSIFNCKPAALVAVIRDIDHHKDWIPNCTISKTLKVVDDTTLIFYEYYDLPWPASDRDVVIVMKLKPHIEKNKIVIESSSANDILKPIKGVVRILDFKAHWTIYTRADLRTHGEYLVTLNPGGDIPSWFVNFFTANGPYTSFLELKKRI